MVICANFLRNPEKTRSNTQKMTANTRDFITVSRNI